MSLAGKYAPHPMIYSAATRELFLQMADEQCRSWLKQTACDQHVDEDLRGEIGFHAQKIGDIMQRATRVMVQMAPEDFSPPSTYIAFKKRFANAESCIAAELGNDSELSVAAKHMVQQHFRLNLTEARLDMEEANMPADKHPPMR